MAVLLYNEINPEHLQSLLAHFNLVVKMVSLEEAIPGSFWQPPEAGLVGNVLYVRDDTPVHSALHEACHYICMDQHRRENLDTDAGGGYEEENGVCYLQILLSKHIAEMGKARMFSDMDEWGYSFRLGSSKAWFEQDADDAVDWLRQYGLINNDGQPAWKVRE